MVYGKVGPPKLLTYSGLWDGNCQVREILNVFQEEWDKDFSTAGLSHVLLWSGVPYSSYSSEAM